MTLAEAQTRLAAVEAQISAIISSGGVNNYSVAGGGHARSVQRNIEFLERERARLEQIVAQLSGGSFKVARMRTSD
jgi:exonuclease VII small subunit